MAFLKFTRWFKLCPFHPLVGGHLTPWKGRLTIPKRSLWITRYGYFNRRCIFKWLHVFWSTCPLYRSYRILSGFGDIRLCPTQEAIPWKKILVPISGWWQQKYVFYFHPRLRKNPILTHIFSKELKPPTSFCVKLLMVSKIWSTKRGLAVRNT